MGDENKPQKTGFLSSLKRGIKKAIKAIAAVFSPPDPELLNVDSKSIIIEALTQKLSSYYSGAEPEINELSYTEDNELKEFNVSAVIKNLHSKSAGVQEAKLRAWLEMPGAEYCHIPVPGAYGVDTFPPNPLPIYNYRPRIKKMILEITNSNYRNEIALDNIQEIIKNKYPLARLVDKTTPMNLGNEDEFCERFISDSIVNSRGKNTNMLRYLRFPIMKVSVDREVDEVLTIRDFEFQLEPPESLFTLDYPDTKDISRILNREKNTISNLTSEGMGRGLFHSLGKLFFRIEMGKDSGIIEPRENSTDEEISFDIKFNCISGFGSGAKVSTVGTVFYYTAVAGVNKNGEKIMTMRYLKRDNFITGA